MSIINRTIGRFRRAARNHRIRTALADPTRHPTILCASTGRVGSNMLHRSIVEARARSIAGIVEPNDMALIGTVAWNLDRDPIPAGRVVKTHDLPYALPTDQPIRVVFSFGCPSDIVLSVLRKSAEQDGQWCERHLHNMHASGPLSDIVERDILRIEEQIAAWRALTGIPIIGIRYDALWEAGAILADFLGMPVQLPPQRVRHARTMDLALIAKVREHYARLDDMVANLPPYWRSG